jgi:3-deoxy-D-manno-octulosonic-acid transferase
VWVHGVSVGEVKAASRFVRLLEQQWPGLEVVITVSTDTGRRVALEQYPGHRVDFYPPDLSWIARGAFDAVRPDLVILVESDLWPNFLSLARERGVPVALVNGRISRGSARRYEALGRLANPVLGALSVVCAQIPLYAERFLALGLPRDAVQVTGNMKFDNVPSATEGPLHAEFRRLLGAGDGVPLLTAGSTHPGEERALAAIRRSLAARGRPFRLVVAPRHPARAEAVTAQLEREGHAVVRRSALSGAGEPPPPDRVVLLDTVGELETVYSLSSLVFVGGTLVPHGGQNVMEPASLGCPVVVGPHLANFRGEIEMLRHADGIAVVPDAAGVEATVLAWLERPEEARALGARARQAILASKGATERTLEVLRPWLDEALRGVRGEARPRRRRGRRRR